MDKKKVIDIVERTAATAAEGAIAYGITRLGDLGPQWVLLLTPVLSLAKSWISTHFGTGSASATKTV